MAGRKVIRDPQTGELKVVPRKGLPREDTVFRRLERSLPRDELMQIFDSSADERFHQLFMFMSDPYIGKKSLPQLAKECGLSYAQVLQAITRGRLDQGMLRMSAHVPQVMEDVAIDAKSKVVTCANCEGAKVIAVTEIVEEEGKRPQVVQKLDDEGRPMWKKCLVCDGVGKLRQVGDKASREILFETMRLTGGRGGPQVQVNVGAGQAMEDTVASVREVLDVQPLAAPQDSQHGVSSPTSAFGASGGGSTQSGDAPVAEGSDE
jgi:hypothetical protein